MIGDENNHKWARTITLHSALTTRAEGSVSILAVSAPFNVL